MRSAIKNEEVVSKKNKKVVIVVIIAILLSYICLFLLGNFLIRFLRENEDFKINVIEKGLIEKNVVLDSFENEKAYIKVELYDLIIDKDRWCVVLNDDKEVPDYNDNSWVKVRNNTCTLEVNEKSKYILVRDEKNVSKYINIDNYINKILTFEVNINDVLLLVGESVEVKVATKTLGSPDMVVNYRADDESVVKIEDGRIVGIGNGVTNVLVSDSYGHLETIEVIVTDLITKTRINDNKKFIPYKVYTVEQARLLDKILEYKINKAGEKTRAGVVTAARFLTLEFQYKIPYFLENGRLEATALSDYVDGEGRYYHKGLYLSEDKYASIASSTTTPKMWGGYLNEYSNEAIRPNGLDCSGFVSWCLYNGGFEPKDIGAGPNFGYPVLTDYGKSQYITYDLLNSGRVKAGDLIGYSGHIGIIIGVDDGNVYVADSILYSRGVSATKYTYSQLVYGDFTHIYDMSEYYVDDGNYTAMW